MEFTPPLIRIQRAGRKSAHDLAVNAMRIAAWGLVILLMLLVLGKGHGVLLAALVCLACFGVGADQLAKLGRVLDKLASAVSATHPPHCLPVVLSIRHLPPVPLPVTEPVRFALLPPPLAPTRYLA